MDSYCINHILRPDYRVYVNVHSSYSEQELAKIRKLSDNVIIIDKAINLGKYERRDLIIPGRNAYLMLLVANELEDLFENTEEDIEIIIGATKGDRVLDKDYIFAEKMEGLLNYMYQEQHWNKKTSKTFKVSMPFKKYTKLEIVNMYQEFGGSIDKLVEECLSCYHPHKDGSPCWSCKPCLRLWVALTEAGYDFPGEVNLKALQYMRLVQDELRTRNECNVDMYLGGKRSW